MAYRKKEDNYDFVFLCFLNRFFSSFFGGILIYQINTIFKYPVAFRRASQLT